MRTRGGAEAGPPAIVDAAHAVRDEAVRVLAGLLR
jgi:hypothetical protein